MRRLFEVPKKQFAEFVEQRDDLLLIVSCIDGDSAVGLKVLRDLEQANQTDVFLLFADNFVQAAPFVSVAIERLREEHRRACQALAEEGRAPLPEMPQRLLDERIAVETRLQGAIEYARSLLPRGGGHRLVWAMFPVEIQDRLEYLRLVAHLVPAQGIRSWMAGVRLIFRDLPGTAEYVPGILNAPRVRLRSLDFSPAAAQESLEEDAQNEELSEEERVQALLMSANLDYAHSRVSEAASKYGAVLSYFQRTGNLLMQAFVLNGYGDLFRHRMHDPVKAQEWYEYGLVPASEAADPLMLATIGRNLGDIAFESGRFADAEQYYDGVEKIATSTADAETKIRALEWRGLSQEQQAAHDMAVASWEAAAGLSRAVGLPELLRQNLEHLERAYRRIGAETRLARVRDELRVANVEAN